MSTSGHQHRLLADECVYRLTIEFLRSSGWDVVTVQDLGLAGATDRELIQHAVSMGRIWLTRDMDFSSIVLYPPALYLGIVVLKMTPQTMLDVHRVLEQALADTAGLEHSLLIIDRNQYRLRR